jgi:hypothetical protein
MKVLASLAVPAAAALVLCVVLPARAAPHAAAQACRSDFTKYCSGVEPGGGRVVACLQQHQDELTPACKSTVDQLAGCGEEVRKICGTASGRSELQECMKTHSSEFSATCRAAAPQR